MARTGKIVVFGQIVLLVATAANFHYLLADTYGNLQQEFDAIRAQILDSDGYVREDMVDVRAAVEGINNFRINLAIAQDKWANRILLSTSPEQAYNLQLALEILRGINRPGISYVEKGVRLAIAYKSPSIQNLSEFIRQYAESGF